MVIFYKYLSNNYRASVGQQIYYLSYRIPIPIFHIIINIYFLIIYFLF
jgi:hypothetical protein